MFKQSDIKEHMEVLGSDGQHVGTVDHMDGSNNIKLTKGDAKDGKHHLIPSFQPLTDGNYTSARRKNSTGGSARPVGPVKGRILTQHTGLPPRVTGSAKPGRKRPG